MVSLQVNSDFFRKYKYQILATFAVSILTFTHGNANSWSATAIPLLQSENTPISTGPITMEEASWIGSLVCIGGLTGNFLGGILINIIGQKKVLMLIIIPHVVLWLTLIYGNLVWHLYLARTVSGLAGGLLYVAIPTYIADIADNKIRGTLGSAFMFAINGGMLSGYTLGAYVSYGLFPQILFGFSAVCLLVLFRLPETPQYLIKRKRYEDAEKSLNFYRNIKQATKTEKDEFVEYLKNLTKTIEGSDESKKSSLSYRDFLEPAAVKGNAIGLGLIFLNQFSGLYAVTLYTSTIFQMSGSTLDPNASTVIFGAVQLLGTFIAAALVDRLGRRILLIASSLGTGLGSFGLATFSYFSQTQDLSYLSWIAVASLSLSILLGSFGLIPLPYVVLTEVLPQKVKAASVTFCICMLSVSAFIVLKSYPVLMETIGLHGVMWISSAVTAVGAVGIYFFLPETKGKRLEQSDNAA
ncbi:unnamed protein product [Hermetia illucens]|uniref:Major facilitator superfamily (MFS) profile domain-containing protein n=1 Tax=Hermetia illucens TaxID=343691 RepID=A0A7R8UY19_HERIL|nr:unnamed protein product [Hermetia illucens]